MQKLASLAASSTPSSPPSEAVRLQIIEQHRLYAEQWLVHCNPVVPQQRLTLYCTRFLIRKLDFVTRLQWILLQQRAGINQDFSTEENLAEALEIFDSNLYPDDVLLQPFGWTKRAYPQYHTVMYVLLHLCIKPDCDLAERAWVAVESFFAEEISAGDNVEYGPKLSVLAVLRDKARAVRNKIQTKRPTEDAGEGARDPGIDSGDGVVESNRFSVGTGGNTTGPDFDLNSADMEEWPDWETLVQDFQLDTSDIFLQ